MLTVSTPLSSCTSTSTQRSQLTSSMRKGRCTRRVSARPSCFSSVVPLAGPASGNSAPLLNVKSSSVMSEAWRNCALSSGSDAVGSTTSMTIAMSPATSADSRYDTVSQCRS
jgi:hypothetical protein